MSIKVGNICVVKISSCVKGHRVYKYNYTVGEELLGIMQRSNIYNKNVTVAKEKERNEIVWRIPEPLAKILRDNMHCNRAVRKALKSKWVLGEGIEPPCFCFSYEPNLRKREVRDCMKKVNEDKK